MLDLGSSGLMTGAWTATMLRRFSGYALGRDGERLRNDRYFGYDEQEVQQEYQRRTGQPPTGRVSDDDLHRLGLLPTLISTHGSGQPDPFGIGYPADIARRLTHLYMWKPVGNYPASSVPMNTSADAGTREIARFIADPAIVPGPVAFVDYSQGSICGGRIRNRIRAGETRTGVTLLGGVTIGNPMRPRGAYAGTVDPGGEGIDPVLETASEPGMCHLAAKGDLYTTNPGGDSGEWERSIFNAVFMRFTGRDSLLEQIGEWLAQPTWETVAAGRAILRGGMFLVKGTGPHVRYHLDQCPGTGRTYYEQGITHQEHLATTRLEKIAASAA
jgi:hypothetical protein